MRRLHWPRHRWRPPVRLMEKLMYDLRGWTVLADDKRWSAQQIVLGGLKLAARRLMAAAGSDAR